MSEWQPIETAPKDGTYVLLWASDPPCIGRVSGHPFMSANDWSVEVRAMNVASYTWRLSSFTHWMPLPQPPHHLSGGAG